ncbi:hypothetical protein F4813DRAFT_392336 [Daldinia decipiens]|uniref:uncharacterized protein n=1 Tax=Daldinia decipiens TaxID=326647 RepID=UPI0020C48913|nr:uncharacterized protein F4813DRAFT_392336 [Daldinia decipiens]KAI1654825.1 hypothetical protein F4813DRAFT_392336 [Daldinia decipiens]
MAKLQNLDVNSQIVLGTPNKLKYHESHTGSSQTRIYYNTDLESQCFRNARLQQYFGIEQLPERLIQFPGHILGPRGSDVQPTLTRVDDAWRDARCTSLGHTQNTVFPLTNAYLGHLSSHQLNACLANLTFARGIPGLSRSGIQHVQSSDPQSTAGSPSNQGRQKRKNAQDDDADDGDDGGSRGRGKKPMNSQSTDARLACPIAKAFPGLRLDCHNHGGFESISRVKEHLYRRHRTPQCQRCGQPFDQYDQFREHTRAIEPCALAEDGFPVLAINHEQEEALRRRADAWNASARAKWDRIYEIVFPRADRPYPSPYIEQHVDPPHRFQELQQRVQLQQAVDTQRQEIVAQRQMIETLEHRIQEIEQQRRAQELHQLQQQDANVLFRFSEHDFNLPENTNGGTDDDFFWRATVVQEENPEVHPSSPPE